MKRETPGIQAQVKRQQEGASGNEEEASGEPRPADPFISDLHAFRTMRKYFSVVSAAQYILLCDDNPRKLIEHPHRIHQCEIWRIRHIAMMNTLLL